MKKVNFKVVLVALSFAFSFLVLGVNRVEAQAGQTTVGTGGSGTATNPTTYGKGVFSLPTGNFVSQQEALVRLDNAMTQLKNLMANMNQGTSIYTSTFRTWAYYNEIYTAVLADNPVNASIVIALTKIAFTQDQSSVPTQADLTSLRNSAINLLQ